jgi:hypothetical protein
MTYHITWPSHVEFRPFFLTLILAWWLVLKVPFDITHGWMSNWHSFAHSTLMWVLSMTYSSYVRFSVDCKLAYLASNLHCNGWTSISHLWTSKWDSEMQWMSNEQTTTRINVHLKNLWLKIHFQKLHCYYWRIFGTTWVKM